MNHRLYRIYRRTWYLHEKILQKFTPAGRFILILILASAVLGLNTKQTMIYQLFGLSVSLLVLSLFYSLRFSTHLSIKRILPDTCTAGEKLTYQLHIINHGKQDKKGLFFKEQLKNPLPDYKEFSSSPEDGEEKRNRFDRWAGYYRWQWLIRKNQGATMNYHPLPTVHGGDQQEWSIHFTPYRRGYIHFASYSICRHDPLGLVQATIQQPQQQNLLVLPKIYPLPSMQFHGSRKHHQGGFATALKTGDSSEFMSLREYCHGDPVKHIDWKSSARTGKTVVREYQDEYFSRYGLVLDTFTQRSHGQIFEEAVSVAASILTARTNRETMIDLMFVGAKPCITTSGQGIAEQHHLLEILASVQPCRDQTFTDLSGLLKSHLNLLSDLAIILIDLTPERKELLDYLSTMQIPFIAMLVVADRKEGEAKLAASHLEIPITLLEVGHIPQGLSQL